MTRARRRRRTCWTRAARARRRSTRTRWHRRPSGPSCSPVEDGRRGGMAVELHRRVVPIEQPAIAGEPDVVRVGGDVTDPAWRGVLTTMIGPDPPLRRRRSRLRSARMVSSQAPYSSRLKPLAGRRSPATRGSRPGSRPPRPPGRSQGAGGAAPHRLPPSAVIVVAGARRRPGHRTRPRGIRGSSAQVAAADDHVDSPDRVPVDRVVEGRVDRVRDREHPDRGSVAALEGGGGPARPPSAAGSFLALDLGGGRSTGPAPRSGMPLARRPKGLGGGHVGARSMIGSDRCSPGATSSTISASMSG